MKVKRMKKLKVGVKKVKVVGRVKACVGHSAGAPTLLNPRHQRGWRQVPGGHHSFAAEHGASQPLALIVQTYLTPHGRPVTTLWIPFVPIIYIQPTLYFVKTACVSVPLPLPPRDNATYC